MNLAWLIAERKRMDLRQGYKRRRGDSRHFRLEWIKGHAGRVFSGAESVTVEAKKTKYVRPQSPYFPYTPGELARVYLNRLMREQLDWARIMPRYRLSERDLRLLAIPAPLAFLPERGREGRFVYVDIGACYFDLFSPWPLNATLNEATGAMGRPAPALQIPPRDQGWLRREKAIRHALFGMLQSQSMSWYKDGAAINKHFLDDHAAPDLVALVKLSCHAIARAAVEEFGCRMWLTDAGIFTEDEGLLFQVWLADEWRLTSKPKAAGRGHLYAQGDYRIGRVASRMGHVDLSGWSNLVTAPPSLAERRRQRLES